MHVVCLTQEQEALKQTDEHKLEMKQTIDVVSEEAVKQTTACTELLQQGVAETAVKQTAASTDTEAMTDSEDRDALKQTTEGTENRDAVSHTPETMAKSVRLLREAEAHLFSVTL